MATAIDKQKKAVQLWRPFVAGAREKVKPDYQPSSVPIITTSRKLPIWHVDAIGFVGCLHLRATIAASNPGGAAVAVTEDAPFSVFSDITFYDVGSKPLGGGMTGDEWYQFIKHGGFTASDDERAHVGSSYSALTTGAGATAGSGTFSLRIPIAINKRTALGEIVNKNSGSCVRLEVTVAPLTSIYSVEPSAGATITVEGVVEGHLDAAPADSRGNPINDSPPGGDTTMFVQKTNYPLNAGFFRQKLEPIDGVLRMLLFTFRDTATGTRAGGDAAWPPTTTIKYEQLTPLELDDWLWRKHIAEQYEYQGVPDTARARSNGVYPLTFFDDFGLRIGVENGFKYLPVSTNVNISLEGTLGAAGNLDVLVNKIYPGNGDPLTLTGGR